MWPAVFHLHVLNRKMEWVKIIRPPRVRTLPVIPTREEVQRLINTVRKIRYRVFFLTVYSMGLQIGEGVDLEIGDIDGKRCVCTSVTARAAKIVACLLPW